MDQGKVVSWALYPLLCITGRMYCTVLYSTTPGYQLLVAPGGWGLGEWVGGGGDGEEGERLQYRVDSPGRKHVHVAGGQRGYVCLKKLKHK